MGWRLREKVNQRMGITETFAGPAFVFLASFGELFGNLLSFTL